MDCIKGLKQLDDTSIDLIVTDPPYGIGFMNKDWDKAIPTINIWKECFRVLKHGAFAFIMCLPRQDCLSHMIINLEKSGFNTSFSSIYWAYASGFPKAQNIGKAVDKKLGAEREVIRKGQAGLGKSRPAHDGGFKADYNITISATPQAKALYGSYAGFQPKPAVEVIIVVMKPLSEKTFVDQALHNSKGITWLDNCRIPFESDNDKHFSEVGFKHGISSDGSNVGWKRKAHKDYNILSPNNKGRFPANLLVSDNILNDGNITLSSGGNSRQINVDSNIYNWNNPESKKEKPNGINPGFGDVGNFSRYFDLDIWAVKKGIKDCFPFLIVPKASKGEKNKGCKQLKNEIIKITCGHGRGELNTSKKTNSSIRENKPRKNIHPTVKPVMLGTYLITLGSRENDIVLDPFSGSGSFAISARMTNRRYICFEINNEYYNISLQRLSNIPDRLDKWIDSN